MHRREKGLPFFACFLFPPKASFFEKGFCWDIVSRRKTAAWDISSQENQDSSPMANASSIGMLLTENVMGETCLPSPTTQKGDTEAWHSRFYMRYLA